MLSCFMLVCIVKANNSQTTLPTCALDAELLDQSLDIINKHKGTYLKDFQVKLDATPKGAELYTGKFSMVLANSSVYLFTVVSSKEYPGRAKLKLYSGERLIAVANNVDENKSTFQFNCQRTGVYHIIISFEDGKEGCALGTLAFLKRLSTFNCPSYAHYSKDTTIIMKKVAYEGPKGEEIIGRAFLDSPKKRVKGTENDTVIMPRYRIMPTDDIKKIEQTELCCIDWLLTNDFKAEKSKRNEVYNFVRQSVKVSNLVNNEVLLSLQKISENSDEVKKAYTLGVYRHLIFYTYEPSDKAIQKAGLLAVAEFITINRKYFSTMPDFMLSYIEEDNEIPMNKWLNQFY